MGDKMSVTFRSFNPSGKEVVDKIKLMADELAAYIELKVPNNRRRSIALTNLEQAAMWAVKANFEDEDKGNGTT
jgi:hypothetical protein